MRLGSKFFMAVAGAAMVAAPVVASAAPATYAGTSVMASVASAQNDTARNGGVLQPVTAGVTRTGFFASTTGIVVGAFAFVVVIVGVVVVSRNNNSTPRSP